MPRFCNVLILLIIGWPGLVLAGDPVAGNAKTDAVAGDAAAGAKTYKRYCRGCHGKDGRGGAHTFMPHIDNLTKQGYIDLLPDEHLETIIREGGEANGMSSYMPAWDKKLSDEEITNVIAHIRKLPLH